MAKHLGWSFPVEIDSATGRIKTVDDDEAVRQSIEVILKTDLSERLMRPSFGAGLNGFMFDSVDLSLISAMSDTIESSIKLWEAHIKNLDISIDDEYDDGSTVYIKVGYETDFSPEKQELIIENDLTL